MTTPLKHLRSYNKIKLGDAPEGSPIRPPIWASNRARPGESRSGHVFDAGSSTVHVTTGSAVATGAGSVAQVAVQFGNAGSPAPAPVPDAAGARRDMRTLDGDMPLRGRVDGGRTGRWAGVVSGADGGGQKRDWFGPPRLGGGSGCRTAKGLGCLVPHDPRIVRADKQLRVQVGPSPAEGRRGGAVRGRREGVLTPHRRGHEGYEVPALPRLDGGARTRRRAHHTPRRDAQRLASTRVLSATYGEGPAVVSDAPDPLQRGRSWIPFHIPPSDDTSGQSRRSRCQGGVIAVPGFRRGLLTGRGPERGPAAGGGGDPLGR
mmetsp:Transcript_14154/g.35289  ORF Transcript_14154/g.35289 Transcript_14154/m.35289 type:complete len:318 (+) Transcript_14154:865-1818(+)